MNIKLKALLITFAILGGLFGFVYLMVYYPGVMFVVFLAGAFYGLYNLVLNSLKSNKKSYTIKEYNETFGGPK